MRRIMKLAMVFWRGEWLALGNNQAVKMMLAKAEVEEPSAKRGKEGVAGAGAAVEKAGGSVGD